MRRQLIRAWTTTVLSATVLTACLGGGGGNGTASEAEPGSGALDSSFGTAGRVVLPASNSELQGAYTAFALGADDSLVMANNSSVLKLDRSGQPAVTFGASTSGPGIALAVGEDASRNVYVLRNETLLKLDPSGNLDPSFGTGGRVDVRALITPHGYAPFNIGNLMVDPAGNLYIAGNAIPAQPAETSIVVIKLDPAGHPISAFGAGGVQILLPRSNAGLTSMAMDGQGNLYLAAQSASGSAALKLDASGQSVPGFGQGGAWHSPPCTGGFKAEAIAVDPSGGIYVGGSCGVPGAPAYPNVFKLDQAGRAVTGFGAGGALGGFLGADGSGTVRALLAPATGGLYAAGDTSGAPCNDFVVAKLDTTTGRFDSHFGIAGQAIFDYANDADAVTWVAMDRNGRLYAAGLSEPRLSTGQCPAVVPGFAGAQSTVVFRLGQ